jgi:NADH-quinone oxidoreductase subunit M
MGFITIGIFTFNQQGVEGSIIQMISHGIVSGALFLIVGVVYDRLHTREIARYGGLVSRMPFYAFVFMVFTMASIGLPGTSGFVGEVLILLGAFRIDTWVSTLAAIGVILGAAYMLWLYRRIIFGELTKPDLMKMFDLKPRELLIFAPLIAATLWIGIYPTPIFNVTRASVANLVATHEAAIAAAHATADNTSAESTR